MREAGLCPKVFASEAQLDDYRRELEARLDTYRGQPLRLSDVDELVTDGFTPSFNLAHHGRDHRRLMEKFAALFQPLVPRFEPALGGGRPRVGFLVTWPNEAGFLRTMGGLVEKLDAERFETVVLCSSRALPACRNAIRRSDIEWVPLPGRWSPCVERILAARCDLLYHRKVGADPLGYFLPFARLAPVQCTSWGTHLTSGIRQIDYYVSSGLIEAETADQQYTETLFRLQSLTSFERRPTTVAPATRSDFGLPASGNLYLCPQRLAKFHPAQDELFRGVLDADPAGYLVLLCPPGREHVMAQLLERLRRTLGRCVERVLVLPGQNPENLRRLLSLGDVLLDLRHYGVSLMAYDAFAMDLPIVTLPGRLKVERYGYAFYHKLGFDGPIAASPEEYVALAVRIGTERDYREHLRREIAQRKHVLFEDRTVVNEHERFFVEAMRRAGKSV